MATKPRKLALDLFDNLYDDSGNWPDDALSPDPTDSEVADLLARVLEAAGHEVPFVKPENMVSLPSDRFRESLVTDLSYWRATLARDAEKAEQEQAVEAKAKELFRVSQESVGAHVHAWDVVSDWTKTRYRAVARHALGELA